MIWFALAMALPLMVLAWWVSARGRPTTVAREKTLDELLADEQGGKPAPPAVPVVVLNDRALSVDAARLALQKTSYEMVGNRHSEDEKLRFKQVMTEFAAVDPLVKRIVERAQGIVSRHPGILQSKIYVHFPMHSKEQVRYALYFAHELGLIYRRKKGSSYQLYPPGETIEVK